MGRGHKNLCVPLVHTLVCFMFFPFSTFLTKATSLFLWRKKKKTWPLSRFIWLSHDHTHSFELRKKNRGSRQHVKKEKKKPQTWTLSKNASKHQTCLFQQSTCSWGEKKFSEHFTFTTNSYQSLPFVTKAIDTNTGTLCLLLLTCEVQLNKQLK